MKCVMCTYWEEQLRTKERELLQFQFEAAFDEIEVSFNRMIHLHRNWGQMNSLEKQVSLRRVKAGSREELPSLVRIYCDRESFRTTRKELQEVLFG